MDKDDRIKDLETCLEDITRWSVIPSAVTQHFSQICYMQDLAKDVLNKNGSFRSIAKEIAGLNKQLNAQNEELQRYELIKNTLEAKEAGFVEGDISELLFSIAFDWDTEKVKAELEAV